MEKEAIRIMQCNNCGRKLKEGSNDDLVAIYLSIMFFFFFPFLNAQLH